MKAPKLKNPLPAGDAGALMARLKALPGTLTARIRRLRGKEAAGAGEDDEATEAEDALAAADDDDIPAHLRPTFFDKHGQKIALAGAYFLFFASLGGTALYLTLNEEAILEAEKARRPSLTVETLKPEIVRLDGETEEDGTPAAGRTAEAGDGAAQGQAEARAEGQADGQAEGEAEEEVALLTPHPDPALIEESPTGPLPIIDADGRMPWRVYSRPANALETRPRIAVVVTEVGIADDTTAQAIGLPGPVTLAAARDEGHEVLLTLPMEPRDFPRSDPGPYALMTTLDEEANLERLNWILSRVTGYIGVANYQGTAFTADERSLRPIMTALGQRGLVYFDTREDPTSGAPRTAEIAGAPSTAADVVADEELSRAAILRKLNEAEVIAKAKQTAVVLIRPYPMAMSRVGSWAQDLEEKGLVLAPLSAVIRARAGAS